MFEIILYGIGTALVWTVIRGLMGLGRSSDEPSRPPATNRKRHGTASNPDKADWLDAFRPDDW